MACGSREESTRGGSVARSGDQLLSSRCATGRRRSFVSRPFLSSLFFSSYPSFSFLSISFLDIPVPPNACCACVRELKFAQRGYGYITRTEALHVVANIQLRGNVAPRRVAFLVYVIAAVASRETPCVHINTYTHTYRNSPYILVYILYTNGRIHVGIYKCMYLGLPVDPSGFASPRTYTRSRGNARTANERASERASQPRRHGCALLTYTPVLLSVSLLPTGPSSSYDRGLAI